MNKERYLKLKEGRTIFFVFGGRQSFKKREIKFCVEKEQMKFRDSVRRLRNDVEEHNKRHDREIFFTGKLKDKETWLRNNTIS